MAVIPIAFVVSALVFVATTTPLYTATSTILVEPTHAAAAGSGNPMLGQAGAEDAVVESQVSLVQSPAVMQRVVDGLHLANDPEFVPPPRLFSHLKRLLSRAPASNASAQDVARFKAVQALQQRLDVVRQPATLLIDVRASSSDRAKAASIANAVAQAYFSDQTRSKFDATKAATERLQDQLDQLKSRALEAEKSAREFEPPDSSDGTVSGDADAQHGRLDGLQREAVTNRAVYEKILARSKAAVASGGLDPSDSRVVARAEAPVSPSFPNIPLILGVALLAGLGLGCALALAVDLFDRRIKTQEQAKASGLPSLATVPEIGARELAHLARDGRADLDGYDPHKTRLLPPGLQPPLLRYAVMRPVSTFAEAIRSIRFALQHVEPQEERQDKSQGKSLVVSVTSAISGEGKTTVASNLAQSLAVLGIKTVLVEGDLRNPQLSRALCPGVRAGLLEVALEEMPLNQAVLVDPLTGLAFIPAPLPKDVALLTEFASSQGMGRVLNEMRSHFDVLIVDSPPLLPLIDGRALVEQSDAVILAVGWDHTPRDVFMKAVELLAPVHDRVIGTVLTRVDMGRLKFYGSYDSSMYGAPYVYGAPPLREVGKAGNVR